MASTISQRELRNDSAAVLRRVEAGEVLTVTRRGVPVADLMPHAATSATGSRMVEADRLVQAMGTSPRWDAAAFTREQEQLDGLLDDDARDPWS